MASIEAEHACIDIPIYNATTRSLKRKILSTATGGRINNNKRDEVIIRALDDISFTLKDGDKLGLIGHNGAGKSTLLRMVGKVYWPTSGDVKIEGSIGSLIDIGLGIDSEATGRENIYIRGGLLGLSKQELNERIDEIVEFCELGNFIDLPLRTYSTGMHMRLAFSISTMIRPEILIMDEWLSVGDEAFRQKAENRMSEIVSGVKILVLASHSRKLIENVCNRVMWLEHGKIRAYGEPEEILNQYFGPK